MLDGWGPTPGRGGRADKWRFDGWRLVGLWRPGRTQVRWRHAHRSAPRRVDLDRESPRQKAWCLIASPERPQRVEGGPSARAKARRRIHRLRPAFFQKVLNFANMAVSMSHSGRSGKLPRVEPVGAARDPLLSGSSASRQAIYQQ